MAADEGILRVVVACLLCSTITCVTAADSNACRHCQRIVPADAICHLDSAGLAAAAGRLCAAFADGLPAESRTKPLRFAGTRCDPPLTGSQGHGHQPAMCANRVACIVVVS